MKRQWGFALSELAVVLALAGLITAAAATVTVPWLARQGLRSGMYEIHSALQRSRHESIKRNRPCRFVLSTGQRTLQVWDGMGTASAEDDQLVGRTRLPQAVGFATPDGTSPVGFEAMGLGDYQVVFNSDGTVASGHGDVVLFGAGQYTRLTLFLAGGMRLAEWTGTGWEL